MKKLFWPVLILAIFGGCLALGGRISAKGIEMPSGTTIEEVPPTLPSSIPLYLETTTTTTTPQRHVINHADYSHPQVIVTADGSIGDRVELREVIGKPHSIDTFASDVAQTIKSCLGVTDRDMAVEVNSQIELKSDLKADIDINYGTLDRPAVFDFSNGLTCSDDGRATSHMRPGRNNVLRYWVVLSGAIRPGHPKGDFAHIGYNLEMPTITMPGLQIVQQRAWGSAVMRCNTILGPMWRINLAGARLNKPDEDCSVVATKQQADQ